MTRVHTRVCIRVHTRAEIQRACISIGVHRHVGAAGVCARTRVRAFLASAIGRARGGGDKEGTGGGERRGDDSPWFRVVSERVKSSQSVSEAARGRRHARYGSSVAWSTLERYLFDRCVIMDRDDRRARR